MNRALLVGIDAYRCLKPLRGCVNDVTNMAAFLVRRCRFSKGDMRLLAGARATRARIVKGLRWLVSDLGNGDRVLFYYSGHGTRVSTRNPHGRVDSMHDAICPVDFNYWPEHEVHAIRDVDFSRIFKHVPKGVEFVWISDSCHSGDLAGRPPRRIQGIHYKTPLLPADLGWRLQIAKKKRIPLFDLPRAAKRLNVALIAACRSDQNSVGMKFKNRYNSVLTHFLLQELKRPRGLQEALTVVVPRVAAQIKKFRVNRKPLKQNPQLEGPKGQTGRCFLQV